MYCSRQYLSTKYHWTSFLFLFFFPMNPSLDVFANKRPFYFWLVGQTRTAWPTFWAKNRKIAPAFCYSWEVWRQVLCESRFLLSLNESFSRLLSAHSSPNQRTIVDMGWKGGQKYGPKRKVEVKDAFDVGVFPFGFQRGKGYIRWDYNLPSILVFRSYRVKRGKGILLLFPLNG